jgi:hypothetical protein
MVSDQQVRKLMKLVKTEKSLDVAAAKAGMSTLTLTTSGLGMGTPWRRWWQAQYNALATVSAGGTPSLPAGRRSGRD